MFENLQVSEVPRRQQVSNTEFETHYHKKNKPVVLTELMQDWPAHSKWNVEYLSSKIGELVVPLYSSKPATNKEHQHAATTHLSIRDYFSLLKQGESDLRIFFYNILQYAPELIKDFKYPKLGLNWVKRLPVLFAGGKGTRVQMHYDIDLADLVLCHFGGPKIVLLFPPEQSPYLYQVPFSFSSLHKVDFCDPDFKLYPALKHLKGYTAKLNHGDALYIPSGYWHHIIYEDIGFSLTLRAFPKKLSSKLTLIKNIFFVRTFEGLMRRIFGQQWNDRNEQKAVQKTNEFVRANS